MSYSKATLHTAHCESQVSRSTQSAIGATSLISCTRQDSMHASCDACADSPGNRAPHSSSSWSSAQIDPQFDWTAHPFSSRTNARNRILTPLLTSNHEPR